MADIELVRTGAHESALLESLAAELHDGALLRREPAVTGQVTGSRVVISPVGPSVVRAVPVFTGGHTRFEGVVVRRDDHSAIEGHYYRPLSRQTAHLFGAAVALYLIVAPLVSMAMGAPPDAASLIAIVLGLLLTAAVATTYSIRRRADEADIAVIQSVANRAAKHAANARNHPESPRS